MAGAILMYMKPQRVLATDRMQQGYRYERTVPVGKQFAPDFTPMLTPPEMLRLGVFGGLYFGDTPKEFPATWYRGAKVSPDGLRHKELNYYGVLAGQPLSVWRANGWIHPDDPRGWFQWYCRYYLGRRHEDDKRQIARWKAFRRHVSQIVAHCRRGDQTCRPRQRQAILQWAYDPRVL